MPAVGEGWSDTELKALTDYLAKVVAKASAPGGAEPRVAVRSEPPIYPVPWTSGRVASWVTTVDHKRIGILYIWTSLVFFLVGGGMAELMRTQLADAERGLHRPQLLQRSCSRCTGR